MFRLYHFLFLRTRGIMLVFALIDFVGLLCSALPQGERKLQLERSQRNCELCVINNKVFAFFESRYEVNFEQCLDQPVKKFTIDVSHAVHFVKFFHDCRNLYTVGSYSVADINEDIHIRGKRHVDDIEYLRNYYNITADTRNDTAGSANGSGYSLSPVVIEYSVPQIKPGTLKPRMDNVALSNEQYSSLSEKRQHNLAPQVTLPVFGLRDRVLEALEFLNDAVKHGATMLFQVEVDDMAVGAVSRKTYKKLQRVQNHITSLRTIVSGTRRYLYNIQLL